MSDIRSDYAIRWWRVVICIVVLAGISIPSQSACVSSDRRVLANTMDSPTDAAVGDFDANGVLDAVVVSRFNVESVNTVNVVFGQGGGSFGAVQALATHTEVPLAWGVEVSDLDGSGTPDIVVAHDAGTAWFDNTGAGSFVKRDVDVRSLGAFGIGLGLGDFDGDGDVDVATSYFGSDEVGMALNNGASTPSFSVSSLTATSGVHDVDVIDLDVDGNLDLVTGSYSGDTVDWYAGNGAGGFAALETLIVADGVENVAVGDVGGDGRPDVVYAALESSTIGMVSGVDGGGRVVSEEPTWVSNAFETPYAVELYDADGDGDLDLFVGAKNTDDTNSLGFLAWLRNTNGVFGDPLILDRSLPSPTAVGVADMDGDGFADVYAPGSADNAAYWYSLIAADASQSQVVGPGSVSASRGKATSFAVLTRDAFGNEVGTGGASVVATLSSPVAVLSLPVVDDGDGNYSVSYSPPFGGVYVLEVLVCGSPIQGTPFAVSVDAQCAPGTVAVGLDGCERCPSNKYSDSVNANTCSDCPANAVSGEGSPSASNCTCLEGYWQSPPVSASVTAEVCLVCPNGGVCNGGRDPPRAAPGFYPLQSDGSVFASCLRSEACGLGGCNKGYTGYLCRSCASGYYSLDEECELCPPSQSGTFVGFLVIVVVSIAGFSAAIARQMLVKAVTSSEATSVASLRDRSFPAVPGKIAFRVFQVIAVLARARFDWPEQVRSASSVMSFATLSSDSLAIECTLGSFETKFVFETVLPLVFVGSVIGVIVVVNKIMGGGLAVSNIAFGVSVVIVPTFHLQWSSDVLRVLDCTRLPDDTYAMDADMSVLCFTGGWWGLFALALPFLAVYALSPLCIAYMLFRKRKVLLDLGFANIYGSLYTDFRNACFLAEPLLMLHSFAFALCAQFLSRLLAVKILLLGGLVALGIGLKLKYDPYYYPLYNVVDVTLNTLALFFLFIGSMFYAERADDSGAPDGVFNFLLVLAIAVVVMTLVLSITFIVLDYLHIRSDNNVSGCDGRDRRYLVMVKQVLARAADAGVVDLDGVRSALEGGEGVALEMIPGGSGV